MADNWMSGATQLRSSRRVNLNKNGLKLVTWHTFECPYSWQVKRAAQYLIDNKSEAHFVFHPTTGEVVQLLPVSTGARTLRSSNVATNACGSVHIQVEVIGYARQPWTSDLTPAGRAGLSRLVAFMKSHGVPNQWCMGTPPPTYPGPGVARRVPTKSGHYYHAAWPANDHGDPGRIANPWAGGGGSTPAPVVLQKGAVFEVTGIKANDPDGGLVIRRDPGLTGATYGTPLPNGTRWYTTGEVSGVWVRGRSPWMVLNDAPAMWVHSGWLDPVPATTDPVYKVTADRLNIRTGPGVDHPVFGSALEKGALWYATGTVTSGWVQGRSPWMKANNIAAQWVHGGHLTP